MNVCIYSFKGGVGKSSIALNLALEFEAGIITNDISKPLKNVLGEDRVLQISPGKEFPKIKEKMKLIYDLGGYADSRAVEQLKTADLVIVPTYRNESPDLSTCIESLREVERYNNNILVIANRCKKDDLDHITDTLSELFSFPIFPLNESTALQRIFGEWDKTDEKPVYKPNTNKSSVSQLAKANKLLAHSYRHVIPQFDNIIDFVKEKI